MATTVVYTKEELKRACDAGYEEIIVCGKLAEQIYKIRRIFSLSKASILGLAAICGPLSIASVTVGGASVKPLEKAAKLTGIEIAIIITAVSVGISLIYSIYKNYDVEFEEKKADDPKTGKAKSKVKLYLTKQ